MKLFSALPRPPGALLTIRARSASTAMMGPAGRRHSPGSGTILALAILLGALLLVSPTAPLGAAEVWHEAEGWALDLPAGWKLTDSVPESKYTAFADQTGSVAAQVFLLESDADRLALAAENRLRGRFGAVLAEGGTSTYHWDGRAVVLSDIIWGGGTFRGYLMVVGGAGSEGAASLGLLVGAPAADWDFWNLVVVSVLDSLALDQEGWYRPGPISALLSEGDEALAPRTNQDIIEREASILAGYQRAPRDLALEAWERFYRVVYRDAFPRLEAYALELRSTMLARGVRGNDLVAALAKEIQAWEYERLGEVSDLRSPLEALALRKGDCDTRGLAFMGIMRVWGFETIMMVSAVHQHSVVGIDYSGEGARFPFRGRQWLIAELTAAVPLGMIAQDQSRIEDWMGMALDFDPWDQGE